MEKASIMRRSLIVAAVCIIAACVAGVIFYRNARPYLQLKKTIEVLKTSDYQFCADYSIQGAAVPLGGTLMTGTLAGRKSGSLFYGEVQKDDAVYLEIYADESGECLFNIRPLFDVLTSFLPKILSVSIPDTYVSLEQLLEITGEDREGKTWTVSADTQGDASADYEIRRIESTADYEYFEVIPASGETTYEIGIPKKEENRFSLKAKQDGITIEAELTVTPGETEAVEMPESSFSDSTIQLFKQVYQQWKALQK
jgi:hypothetical protein